PQEWPHDLRELREIRILYDVLDWLRETDRAGGVGEGLDPGNSEVDLGKQRRYGLLDRGLPLAPVLHDHADECAVHTARESTDDREVAVHTGRLADDVLDPPRVTVGVIE